jgi:hypothetical protein
MKQLRNLKSLFFLDKTEKEEKQKNSVTENSSSSTSKYEQIFCAYLFPRIQGKWKVPWQF